MGFQLLMMNIDKVGWFPGKLDHKWWHSLLKAVLKMRTVPQHIAFIMDGNRRYAHSHNFDSVIQGHLAGFEQLTQVIYRFVFSLLY